MIPALAVALGTPVAKKYSSPTGEEERVRQTMADGEKKSKARILAIKTEQQVKIST